MSRRTIQSPGVEIREIDLTQRPALTIGTSVFIPGFSNQGPTDEVLNVGTFSDFEEIYGKPTNAAERYFYHSVRQVFNSDANVYVTRLPYGSAGGLDSASNKYTALVYPVVTPYVTPITQINSTNIKLSAVNGGITTGESITGVFSFEIITKDSNGVSKYTTFSTENTATCSSLSVTIPQSALSGIKSDTLISGLCYTTAATAAAVSGFKSSLSASDYYIIGNPTLVELTQSEYNKINDGNFTWSDLGNVGQSASFTSSTLTGEPSGAGIIVLNKAKTTINNSYEGYYAGIIDGVNFNPATKFDGALKQYAPTSTNTKAPTAFSEVPSTRLDYSLSAESTSNARTISRTLEDIPKFEIQGAEFVDTLAFGLFKVRVTPFSNTDLKLSYFLAEGYTGSLNSYRKIQNENGGERRSFFLEDQDDSSPNVKILVNPYISKYSGDWTSLSADAPTKFVRTNRTTDNDTAEIQHRFFASKLSDTNNYKSSQGIFGFGSYSDSKITSKNIGNVPTKLQRVFDIASNVDQFNIDVSIEAGLGTIFTTIKNSGSLTSSTSSFDDTQFLEIGSYSAQTGFYTINENMIAEDNAISVRDDYRAVFNKFEEFARQTRKDHIFIADPIRQLLVQGENSKVLDDKSKNFSTAVYWPLRHQFGIANSNFATTYANWIKVYDGVADRQVWVPFSGNAAGIYARNDANYAPWYAPAGYTRGVVTSVSDIAISPTQRQRDQLYRIALNPVTQFPNEGIIVFGQKTLQRKPSAFDRINVRRMFLDLEKRTRNTLRYFIFEPNTFLTRTRVVNTLTPIFENAKQTEGINDYIIVCDERNNTNDRIQNNELVVDIYIKPVRAAEFILVNFYAVNNDVNFSEFSQFARF